MSCCFVSLRFFLLSRCNDLRMASGLCKQGIKPPRVHFGALPMPVDKPTVLCGACAIGRPDQRKRLEKRERKNSFDELQFVPLRFSLLSRCNDLGMASGLCDQRIEGRRVHLGAPPMPVDKPTVLWRLCDRKTGTTQEMRETREED